MEGTYLAVKMKEGRNKGRKVHRKGGTNEGRKDRRKDGRNILGRSN